MFVTKSKFYKHILTVEWNNHSLNSINIKSKTNVVGLLSKHMKDHLHWNENEKMTISMQSQIPNLKITCVIISIHKHITIICIK